MYGRERRSCRTNLERGLLHLVEIRLGKKIDVIEVEVGGVLIICISNAVFFLFFLVFEEL